MNESLMKDFRQLASYFISVMEGDTHLIEDAYKLLNKYHIVDENGFEICEEDS